METASTSRNTVRNRGEPVAVIGDWSLPWRHKAWSLLGIYPSGKAADGGENRKPEDLLMPDTVRNLKVKGSGSSKRMRLSSFYLGLVTHKTKGKRGVMEKRERITKSLLSSNELFSLISLMNSGRYVADSFQFSFSMLNIRSDLLSRVFRVFTLTNISRTS